MKQTDRFGKCLNIGDTVKSKSNEIMTVVDVRDGENGLKVKFKGAVSEGWIDSSFVYKLNPYQKEK